jgi:hypothetical protein
MRQLGPCIVGRDLVVRVGPRIRDALPDPTSDPWTSRAIPSRAFVYVDPAGVRRSVDLTNWVRQALAFVGTLPPKAR